MTPKEEQKQHLIDMMKDDEELGLYENWVEDAEKESTLSDLNSKAKIFWSGYRVGVKSKERSYSEEQVKLILDKTLIEYSDIVLADIPEWFDQFKKK
jgi:hypothetical protein